MNAQGDVNRARDTGGSRNRLRPYAWLGAGAAVMALGAGPVVPTAGADTDRTDGAGISAADAGPASRGAAARVGATEGRDRRAAADSTSGAARQRTGVTAPRAAAAEPSRRRLQTALPAATVRPTAGSARTVATASASPTVVVPVGTAPVAPADPPSVAAAAVGTAVAPALAALLADQAVGIPGSLQAAAAAPVAIAAVDSGVLAGPPAAAVEALSLWAAAINSAVGSALTERIRQAATAGTTTTSLTMVDGAPELVYTYTASIPINESITVAAMDIPVLGGAADGFALSFSDGDFVVTVDPFTLPQTTLHLPSVTVTVGSPTTSVDLALTATVGAGANTVVTPGLRGSSFTISQLAVNIDGDVVLDIPVQAVTSGPIRLDGFALTNLGGSIYLDQTLLSLAGCLEIRCTLPFNVGVCQDTTDCDHTVHIPDITIGVDGPLLKGAIGGPGTSIPLSATGSLGPVQVTVGDLLNPSITVAGAGGGAIPFSIDGAVGVDIPVTAFVGDVTFDGLALPTGSWTPDSIASSFALWQTDWGWPGWAPWSGGVGSNVIIPVNAVTIPSVTVAMPTVTASIGGPTTVLPLSLDGTIGPITGSYGFFTGFTVGGAGGGEIPITATAGLPVDIPIRVAATPVVIGAGTNGAASEVAAVVPAVAVAPAAPVGAVAAPAALAAPAPADGVASLARAVDGLRVQAVAALDQVGDWLVDLPPNPLAEAVSGLLWFVRAGLSPVGADVGAWGSVACVKRRYCVGANLAGADLAGQDLSSINFTGANLYGADLTKADLESAILDRAILGKAHLDGANLYYATLNGADLTGASLTAAVLRADFTRANLTGANLTGATVTVESGTVTANLTDANLTDAVLSGISDADLLTVLRLSRRVNLSGVDLSNRDLSAASLAGATLTGADLTGTNLSGANLAGAGLQGAVLADTRLTGAVLSGATVTGADLSGKDLSGVDLTGANAAGANLTGATLAGAVLARADLSNATLTRSVQTGATGLSSATLTGAKLAGVIGLGLAGADLAGKNLTRTDLTGADLTSTNLAGANLTGATLLRADLGHATLTGANLADAVLTGAHLGSADLSHADLRNAVLTGVIAPDADFTAAVLTSAGLSTASLRGADLTSARLLGADLSYADLSDTNLTEAGFFSANLTRALFIGATWNHTTCPDGSTTDIGCNEPAPIVIPAIQIGQGAVAGSRLGVCYLGCTVTQVGLSVTIGAAGPLPGSSTGIVIDPIAIGFLDAGNTALTATIGGPGKGITANVSAGVGPVSFPLSGGSLPAVPWHYTLDVPIDIPVSATVAPLQTSAITTAIPFDVSSWARQGACGVSFCTWTGWGLGVQRAGGDLGGTEPATVLDPGGTLNTGIREVFHSSGSGTLG